MKNADFRMRQKWAAEHVAVMTDAEALQWAVKTKDDGNDLFHRKQYEAACDMYLLSFVGLRAAPGCTDFPKESVDAVQLPVLCNLAACKLSLKVP